MSSAPALKRGLSLWLLTFYGLGNILGAGIYVLVGKVAGSAGLYAPLSFLTASLVAGLTAFTYVELSTRFPVSAGEAVYVRKGLGYTPLSVLVGLLIILMGAVSAATISRGFVGYLQVLWSAPEGLAISALILVLGGLAIWGIREAVGIAAVITGAEIFGLLLVIWVGSDALVAPATQWQALWPPFDWVAWNGILFGAFLAFYAFIGFEDMVNVAEEVKHPGINLPRAILLALLISSLLYVAVALVAVMALPAAQLAQSDAPLALIFTAATGRSPWLLSLIGMLAVVNGALVQIIMGSRVLYGMSSQGWLPAPLAWVSARTHTPVLATLLMAGLVLLLALAFPLITLAQSTSLLVLLVFALVNLALIRLKVRDPHPAGATCIPGWVPWAGMVTCVGLLAVQGLQWVS